jgi:putative transposase
MKPVSYKRHRFPSDVIRHAVWLYFRFMLSRRGVEELFAQRRIEVSYETIRCWTRKFGRLYA